MIRQLLLSLLLAPPALAQTQPPERAPAYREAELAALAQLHRGGSTERGCTAVLITPTAALTAAHCTRPEHTHSLTFRPGPSQTDITVATVIPHPDHIYGVPIPGNDRYRTDIALLILDTPVDPSIATPIPLAPAEARDIHSVYGFSIPHDRALMGSDTCQVGPVTQAMILSSCVVFSGQSGGALLRDLPDGPALVGILVASIPDEASPARSLALQPDPSAFPALAELLQNAPTASQ